MRPKQLLDLAGGRTMIQHTVDRLGELVPPERTLVVTNKRLTGAISAQLPQLPSQAIIGEPCKRDTAPCIGLAAFWVARDDPEATMLVMPADHLIKTDEQFQKAVEHAAALVDESPGRIVTFGIRPGYPAETFGYIERGEPLAAAEARGDTFQVRQFREKPRADVARQYVDSGNFYWNSGIFLWKAETILEQLARHEPAMFERLQRIARAIDTPEFGAVLKEEFTAIEGKSIDYAVMERADDVAVVEAPFDWDDLGNWHALPRIHGTDARGNTIVGRNVAINTTGTIIRGDDDHLIVTLGLTDCLVVHTPDATLVASKHDEEAVRQVVEVLKDQGWDDYL